MKRFIILIGVLLIFGLQSSFSKNNEVEISLLTCSSGSASFEAWGHSAIRIIYNDKKETDIVYDFGRFDFNTTNFYWNFIKGKLRYGIGLRNSNSFFKDYQLENREIIEQKLNLSNEVKLKIIKRLEHLHKPDNRYYYYDFIDKNCTTQLRDLIIGNVNSDIKIQTEPRTYRFQINEYLDNRQWTRLGINLLLGSSADNKVDTYESMFLPYYLYAGLNNLRINGNRLAISERKYNIISPKESKIFTFISPTLIFTVLLCLILFSKSRKIQLPVIVAIGLTGFILLLISIITEHQDIKNNFNLLWCNPLYLLSIILMFRNKLKLQYYLSVTLQLMILVMIFIWIEKIQSWEVSFFPLVILLSIYNIRIIKTGYNRVGCPDSED